jgi:hypothetical protein
MNSPVLAAKVSIRGSDRRLFAISSCCKLVRSEFAVKPLLLCGKRAPSGFHSFITILRGGAGGFFCELGAVLGSVQVLY